jgi:histidyl-tRNA synthetase
MSSYEKTLIGDSIPLMEVDDEEDSNLTYEMISDAEINADFVDIVDNFGKEEFKEIFLNLYDEIESLEVEKQRYLCEKLIDKIYEIYEFEFSPMLTFDNEEDIDDFLKFIEFIEFDYIDFLAKIVTGLDLDQLKKDLNLFLVLNWNKIYDSILKFPEIELNSELISIFFRTYNREGTFEFIKSRLEKDKMLVILKSMEGESNNE